MGYSLCTWMHETNGGLVLRAFGSMDRRLLIEILNFLSYGE